MVKLVSKRKLRLMITRMKIIQNVRRILEVQNACIDLLSYAIQKPRFDHTVATTPDLIIRVILRRFHYKSMTKPSLFLASRLVVITISQKP